MKKIVETAFCDMDYMQHGAMVPAEHVNVVILGSDPLDLCNNCVEHIHKWVASMLTPDLAIEAPQPEPHVSPKPGTPEYTAALRAFADAQNPPIRYMYYSKARGKDIPVFGRKIRRLYEENEQRLRAAE